MGSKTEVNHMKGPVSRVPVSLIPIFEFEFYDWGILRNELRIATQDESAYSN